MPKTIPAFNAPSSAMPAARAEARSPLPHAFVLGAGFSKAVNNAMPLLPELGTRIASEMVKRPSTQLLPEAAQLALRNGSIPGGDVENWLSSLAAAAPFVSEAEAHYNAGVFAEIASIIGSQIDTSEREALKSPVPPWLLELARLWNTVGATIVTFNYDTLIEHGCSSVGPMQNRWPNVAFRLLKVHGSTNWWRTRGNRDATVEEEPLLPGWGFDEVARQGIGDERVLVPPVAVKGAYYDPALIRRQWQQARFAVENASSIWIAGYRLPLNDLATTTLISQHLASNAEIVVADLNPDGPANVLSQLGRHASQQIAGADSMASIATMYGNQIAHEMVPEFAEMLHGVEDHVPIMVRVVEADPAVPVGIGKGLHRVVNLETIASDLVLTANHAPLSWDDGPHSISTSTLRDAIAAQPQRIVIRYRGTEQLAIALSDLKAWPTAEGVRWIFVEA